MIRLFGHYIPSKLLLLFAIEALALFASIYAGVAVRFYDQSHDSSIVPHDLAWPAASFAIVTLMFMTAFGLYSADLPQGAAGMAVRLIVAFVIGIAGMSFVFYLVPDLYVGRGAFGLSWAMALIAVFLLRIAFFRWTRVGMFDHRILVLGTGTRAVNVDLLTSRSYAATNLHVVGFLPLAATQHHVQPARILPGQTSVLEAVRKYAVNEIIIAVRDRRGGGLPMDELLQCKLSGVKVTELSSFYERERGQLRIDSMNASWLVFGEGFRLNQVREMVKRAFDVSVSLLLLLCALPVMVITAILILVEDGRPIFY